VKKTLPKNTIFSSMFPAWLYKNISTLRPNQPVSILALIEDKYTTGFPESAARIMLMDPDKTALASKTKKISIVFNDLESTWWVYDDGSIFKILMPLQKALIEKSTEKDAKQFLNVSKK